jgi:hypothetical protein
MNRLRFLLARTLRDEGALQRLSVPESEIMAQLAGKSVALIGNARSLAEGQRGPEIDAADLVIRINRAPMPSAQSHGERTDILALATSIPQADLDRLHPGRILWMSHKRKRLPFAVASSPGFHLPVLEHFQRLQAQLHAPPTTGLMLIDLLSRSAAREIRLYGFDFFTSLSLSGRRTAEQVPHDFAAERAFVQALMARDHRFAQIAAT